MQKHNQIKAFFFLGIFSILFLHQVLPHIHHHQHDNEHSHTTINHNDNSGHHHDTPEEENDIKGFLDLFLGMHSHSLGMTNALLVNKISANDKDVRITISPLFEILDYESLLNTHYTRKTKCYRIYKNYFKYYLSSLDSRGPPSLG